jgi:hypothetical protein
VTAGLRQSPYRVYCRGTQPNHESASSDQREGFLLFDCAVRDMETVGPGLVHVTVWAANRKKLLRIDW